VLRSVLMKLMLSNRIGLLGLLAILPAAAQVATTEISPRQHHPMHFHGMHDDGTVESENWSGYAVTGKQFTQAVGSWTVPAATCTKGIGNLYSSFWVGIDGYSSNTVEQTGTDSDCHGATPLYYAWYEFYPKASVLISSLTISPGDEMMAEVSYSGNEFTVTITDHNTGQTFSASSKVAGAQRTSAEWIAEAPCCTQSGGILPLADFGIVSLGEDYTGLNTTNVATDSTTTGAIGTFPKNKVNGITMVSSGGVNEAVPGALTSDKTSFQVTWVSQ